MSFLKMSLNAEYREEAGALGLTISLGVQNTSTNKKKISMNNDTFGKEKKIK